jgi:hypothetical protein
MTSRVSMKEVDAAAEIARFSGERSVSIERCLYLMRRS